MSAIPERVRRLGAMRIVTPTEWVRTIMQAMVKANLRLDLAAHTLGVTKGTLLRWLQDPLCHQIPRLPVGRPRKKNPKPKV